MEKKKKNVEGNHMKKWKEEKDDETNRDQKWIEHSRSRCLLGRKDTVRWIGFGRTVEYQVIIRWCKQEWEIIPVDAERLSKLLS